MQTHLPGGHSWTCWSLAEANRRPPYGAQACPCFDPPVRPSQNPAADKGQKFSLCYLIPLSFLPLVSLSPLPSLLPLSNIYSLSLSSHETSPHSMVRSYIQLPSPCKHSYTRTYTARYNKHHMQALPSSLTLSKRKVQWTTPIKWQQYCPAHAGHSQWWYY